MLNYMGKKKKKKPVQQGTRRPGQMIGAEAEEPENRRLTMSDQHMLWFCGLRGAIAYALARQVITPFSLPLTSIKNTILMSPPPPQFPGDEEQGYHFRATTTMLILLSVFFLGGSTIPVLKKLGIKYGVKAEGAWANNHYNTGKQSACLDWWSDFDRRCVCCANRAHV
jgi:NhaP-type Na+/H+ or K+/H+ antiporter